MSEGFQVGLTGHEGPLGVAIQSRLLRSGVTIKPLCLPSDLAQPFSMASGDSSSMVMKGCSVVVHTAAHGRSSGVDGVDALAMYRRLNRDATFSLVRLAVVAGVRRFVFISSIGVCGILSDRVYAMHPGMKPAPEEPYTIAQCEAERGLLDLCSGLGIELVIIRLPLIHGPGIDGSMRDLCQLIATRRPLPIGRARNRRSLLGLANVTEAIEVATVANLPSDIIRGRRAPIWHLADEGTISTRKMVEVIARGMGAQSPILDVPRPLIRVAGNLMGQGAQVRRLFGDLVVDSTAFCRDFGWRPSVSIRKGLYCMGRAWSQCSGW